jgi:hypothetical protein
MSKRKLNVGPDGRADVILLTNPVPRHLSIVNWGANDRPAESWKSADAPREVLRSPPKMVDINGVSLQSIQSFVVDTLDAWTAVVDQVLSTSLSAAERGARIRGHTVQAGARVAALATAIGHRAKVATKSYKAVDLSLPEMPTGSTLQGELDRRQFSSAVQQASAALLDQAVAAMAGHNQEHYSPTEAILNAFSHAANFFEQWSSSLPDGVVGISQPDSDEPTVPETAEKAGARHSKADSSVLENAINVLTDLLGKENVPSTTENFAMKIEDFNALAEANPLGFLTTIRKAITAVKDMGVDDTRKFMWGDTGVDPHTEAEVMGPLKNMVNSDQLAGLITSAISGVDVNGAVTGDSPQVASTMRSAMAKSLSVEITNNPDGELATAFKSVVSESVAVAIKQVIENLVESGTLSSVETPAAAAPDATQNGAGIMDGFGSDPSVIGENGLPDVTLLMGETPSLNNPVSR